MDSLTVPPEPRVFIANMSASHDYEQAKKYGKIRWITRGFTPYTIIDRIRLQIATAILETTPNDYLLLSGAGVTNTMCSLLWYERHGSIKLLLFDRSLNDYREINLERSKIQTLFEVLMS